MTKLTSLVLKKKDIEVKKPSLKQQISNKFQSRKKELKSNWGLLWSKKPKVVINQHKAKTIGPLLAINVPITIYNTNVNNYYNSDNADKPVSTKTSIVQQLIVLSPFQIYGFLFVCSLLLIVVGFGILQVHRVITILQSLLDGIKYLLLTFFSNSSNLFTFLKSFIL